SPEITDLCLLTATSFIEKDPLYDKLAAGLLKQKIYQEVFQEIFPSQKKYQQIFITNIQKLVAENILDNRLLDFNLEKLSHSLVFERDDLFNYLGLETL